MANDEITTKEKYEAMIEYVSPQAKIYGKRYASQSIMMILQVKQN